MDQFSILKCSNLSYSIGYKKILKSINFNVQAGEIVGLTGDNGSGKSSLLKLLLKKNKQIFWNCTTTPQKFKISYLGHEPGLYSSLTLGENLDYFSGISQGRMNQKKMKELLALFKLEKRLYDPVYTFSRGMLQKAALIRSIGMNSCLYLLDEPYTGLDESSVAILNEAILDLKKESSVILVVHSSELVKKLTDRIVHLEKGETV